MRIGTWETAERPLIIAEIGNNHEGSYALAEEMVGRAAEAGARAVKFQTFRTEHFVSRSDAERFARLKSFELGYRDFEKLASVAKACGVLFISTPLDPRSAEFLSGFADAVKISSSDNVFYPLLESAARGGRPILLSCGLAELEDIDYSAAFIRKVWREAGIDQELAALHCVTAYPVPPEEANLAAITALRARLPHTVGYSDHTLGIEAARLAVALGAEIIEKHFTLDRNQSDFRDHKISSDPEELRRLVQAVGEAKTLLGAGSKTIQPSERGATVVVRRSIVAARDLAAGETLGWESMTWVRPGGGLPPGKEVLLLGRRLAQAVPAGQPLLLSHCLAESPR